MIHENDVIGDWMLGGSGAIKLMVDGAPTCYHIVIRRDEESGKKEIKVIPRTELIEGETIMVPGDKDFSRRKHDKRVTVNELEDFLNLLAKMISE
ncbi:MAG: hypothetical protein WC022_02715 [Parcubacteria group bacterium]